MRAGIDVGSSIIKTVTAHPDGYKYRSTRTMTKEKLVEALAQDGVDEVLATGIGVYDLPFPHSEVRNAHPLSEIQMQVFGVEEILKNQGNHISEYCLVSIGTGISYTNVEVDYHAHLPVGSPIGGGYMVGMGRMLIPHVGPNAGAILQETNRLGLEFMKINVFKEKQPDLLYKDVAPNSDNNLIGEMVVASCANMTKESSVDARCFALANTVAIGIIKDLMMYKGSDSYKGNDIVCIGTVAQYEIIQKLLVRYGEKLELQFHFPYYGEYSAALGALIKMNKRKLV